VWPTLPFRLKIPGRPTRPLLSQDGVELVYHLPRLFEAAPTVAERFVSPSAKFFALAYQLCQIGNCVRHG
jgi:hypothetical protein